MLLQDAPTVFDIDSLRPLIEQVRQFAQPPAHGSGRSCLSRAHPGRSPARAVVFDSRRRAAAGPRGAGLSDAPVDQGDAIRAKTPGHPGSRVLRVVAPGRHWICTRAISPSFVQPRGRCENISPKRLRALNQRWRAGSATWIACWDAGERAGSAGTRWSGSKNSMASRQPLLEAMLRERQVRYSRDAYQAAYQRWRAAVGTA